MVRSLFGFKKVNEDNFPLVGFLLKVSCVNNDNNIFENLYHHNAVIRSEAVSYLVANFEKVNLGNDDNGDILKLTVSERLNDENPTVINEILKIDSALLETLIGADELVGKISKILMRYWKSPDKWRIVRNRALQLLTSSRSIRTTQDTNVVLLTVMPFLFPAEKDVHEAFAIVKESHFAQTLGLKKLLPDTFSSADSVLAILENSTKLPSSELLLNTIQNILMNNQKTGNISIQFSFLALALSMKSSTHEFGLSAMDTCNELLKMHKLVLTKGELTDTQFFKNQEIPATAVAFLLKKIIASVRFNNCGVEFGSKDKEAVLKLKIFEFIIDKFFTSPPNVRQIFNDVTKTFLDKVCDCDHLKKVQFFANFCASHVVHQDNDGTSLKLQIRSLRLLNHVVASNIDHAKRYDVKLFHNLLIALSSEQQLVREAGMAIVETLLHQQILPSWKFLFEKIQSRKNEILMDGEQLSLVLFLISSKKSSAHMKSVLESLLKEIEEPETFDYIRSSLMLLLKHSNDKRVVDVFSRIAQALIEKSSAQQIARSFDEHKSTIIKLVLMKLNQTNLSSSWNLVITALECHQMLSTDDGKFYTPSMLVLRSIDEESFTKLHPDHRSQIFQSIIKCSMNEHPRILQASQRVFQLVPIDCKVVKSIIAKMPQLGELRGKKQAASLMANPLLTEDWKVGMTLLELLQNKSKGLVNQQELIAVLFDLLEKCTKSTAESEVEYTRQIVLSLLLSICQKISPDGKGHRALGIGDGALKSELVVKCIKESENPQTHHHALLLLAQLALMTPDQVLNDILAIFTFVGTTLVRHEDSYSFQIISKIIENVVPTLTQDRRGDEDVVPILKIFASIVIQVPYHRRLLLFKKLLQTFGPEKYLWMFIGLVMESQVMSHQKGQVQDELPQKVQAALAIAKEFDIKTIVESSTALIVYIKSLPMVIEESMKSKASADKECAIFSCKTHTDHQLRHFKYLTVQFLKNLLASSEVSAKVSELDKEMKMDMKGLFQEMILNALTMIHEISKGSEQQRKFEKSWMAILQNAIDMLEGAVGLLAPEMLLLVVAQLLLHDFLLVRKKVVELLNRKLESGFFDSCEGDKVMKLMDPIRKICETIGNEDTNTALESVQQSTLITIRLLAKKLAGEYPDEFVDILEQLTNRVGNEKIKTAILLQLILCIAELTADLKVRAIGLLGIFMPSILKYATEIREDDQTGFLLLYSVVSALLRIIETVPLFLSPYLPQIITQLSHLTPGLKLLDDNKITLTLTKIAKVWTTMAQLIPTRVLIPAINDVYEKAFKKGHYSAIEPLMALMNEIFQNIDGKEVKNYQSEFMDFFLKALQFRCDVLTSSDIKLEEINAIESCIIRALVGMCLKLSEGSFRPLFEKTMTWAIKDEPENYDRAITFFRLTSEVSAALKSLFLLFSSELVDVAGPLLDKCNRVKNSEDSCFGKDDDKNLYLTEFLLRTLDNIFVHDHQNFINTQRFDIVMQPIVDLIGNEPALNNEKIHQLVCHCISHLATAASDDILWKQLNYQVLMKTRSDNAAIRIFGIEVCVAMAKTLGEDFEPLVPETMPFLSELLEDEDYKVVEACQNGVRELETTVGESLQKYF